MHLRHPLRQRRFGHHPAHLPAGQRQQLAGRSDLDRALRRQGEGRDVRRIAGDHFLPHLVADDGQVMLSGQFHDGRQHRRAGHAAGGIVWRVQQDSAGIRRNRGCNRRGACLPVGRLQFHPHRPSACPLHQRRIGIIGRREQDHLIAGPRHRHDAGGQRLGGTRGDDHLLGRHVQPLPTAVEIRHRRAQFKQAAHRRILIITRCNCFGSRRQHLGRPAEIRKALPQIDGIMLPGQARHMLEDGGPGLHGRFLPCRPAQGQPLRQRAAIGNCGA